MFALHHLGKRIRTFGVVDTIAWTALLAATVISFAKHPHISATADVPAGQTTLCCGD